MVEKQILKLLKAIISQIQYKKLSTLKEQQKTENTCISLPDLGKAIVNEANNRGMNLQYIVKITYLYNIENDIPISNITPNVLKQTSGMIQFIQRNNKKEKQLEIEITEYAYNLQLKDVINIVMKAHQHYGMCINKKKYIEKILNHHFENKSEDSVEQIKKTKEKILSLY